MHSDGKYAVRTPMCKPHKPTLLVVGAGLEALQKGPITVNGSLVQEVLGTALSVT